MALQIQGNSGTVAEVEVNSRAMRVVARPEDVGVLGEYSVLATTGTMAAGLAAAAPIFSFRWTNTPNLALIRSIAVDLVSLGTGFTAGVGFIDMVVARSFSASDTGGAAVVMTGNNNKLRTSFGTSLVGDVRIATTATLTAGTRTLDANALAGVRFGVTTATNTIQLNQYSIFSPDLNPQWPLVLAQNEGFILRATVPATGTWQADINVDWQELASF